MTHRIIASLASAVAGPHEEHTCHSQVAARSPRAAPTSNVCRAQLHENGPVRPKIAAAGSSFIDLNAAGGRASTRPRDASRQNSDNGGGGGPASLWMRWSATTRRPRSQFPRSAAIQSRTASTEEWAR